MFYFKKIIYCFQPGQLTAELDSELPHIRVFILEEEEAGVEKVDEAELKDENFPLNSTQLEERQKGCHCQSSRDPGGLDVLRSCQGQDVLAVLHQLADVLRAVPEEPLPVVLNQHDVETPGRQQSHFVLHGATETLTLQLLMFQDIEDLHGGLTVEQLVVDGRVEGLSDGVRQEKVQDFLQEVAAADGTVLVLQYPRCQLYSGLNVIW